MVPLFRIFLSKVFKVCSIPSLMYWKQTRLLPQSFIHEIELLGEKELLHNTLPELGACRLQLINLTFFNAFLIRSEICKFSRTYLIIGKALRLFGLKVEIKGEIFFFSFFFTFRNSLWGILKACTRMGYSHVGAKIVPISVPCFCK